MRFEAPRGTQPSGPRDGVAHCLRVSSEPLVRVPLLPRGLRAALLVALAALVASLSLVPGPRVPGTGSGFVSVYGHVVMYAAVAFGLAYGLAGWDVPPARKALVVFGLAIVYGFAMEALQLLRPTRSFEAGDLAANAVGAAIGSLWCWVEPRLRYWPLAGASELTDR